MKADLAVFDPATVRDRATFAEPHAYAEGVRYVFVNGILVVDEGRLSGLRPGRVLPRSGSAATAVGAGSQLSITSVRAAAWHTPFA